MKIHKQKDKGRNYIFDSNINELKEIKRLPCKDKNMKTKNKKKHFWDAVSSGYTK